MRYLENTAIGVILFVAAFSLEGIYGNSPMGFVALMVLTFMGIQIVLVANQTSLDEC